MRSLTSRFILIFIFGFVFAFGMLFTIGSPMKANAASVSVEQDTFSNASVAFVVVARDITPTSNCEQTRNGIPKMCSAGAVIGTFVVSQKEAQARGEAYIKLTGNSVTDDTNSDKLMRAAHTKFAPKPGPHKIAAQTVLNALFMSAKHPMTPPDGQKCSTDINAGYYTASNFPSPAPRIRYTAYFTIISDGYACENINVSQGQTEFYTSGSPAYFNYNSVGVGYNDTASCPTNIPVRRYYNWNTTVGDTFTNGVQSGCLFDHKASGYLDLVAIP